jgi:hypothetical protein
MANGRANPGLWPKKIERENRARMCSAIASTLAEKGVPSFEIMD